MIGLCYTPLSLAPRDAPRRSQRWFSNHTDCGWNSRDRDRLCALDLPSISLYLDPRESCWLVSILGPNRTRQPTRGDRAQDETAWWERCCCGFSNGTLISQSRRGRLQQNGVVGVGGGHRGTSLIRNSLHLGPYGRTMPRTLWWQTRRSHPQMRLPPHRASSARASGYLRSRAS